MSTQGQVIAKFQAEYPQSWPNIQTQLFNDVHREICARIQVRNSSSTLSLTANQQEYQWDSTGAFTQIHEISYVPNATPGSGTQLFQMDINKLASEITAWRNGLIPPNTTPYAYYISSAPSTGGDAGGGQGVIGIWPPPPASTVAGYPNVTYYVNSAVTLQSTDPVPVQLLNDDIYVYRMCVKFATLYAKDDIASGRWLDKSSGKGLDELEFEKNILFVKQNNPVGLGGPLDSNAMSRPGALYIQGQNTKMYWISRFLQVYGEECGVNIANQMFDEAHRIVCSRVQVQNGFVDITVTASQQEYNYDPNGYVLGIHEGYWMPSANTASWQVLLEKTRDEFAQIQRGWLSASPSGTPINYYMSSTSLNADLTGGQEVLGLWPPPNQSTIGTAPNNYPRVRLFVQSTAPLSNQDLIPSQLLDGSPYLFYMCQRYCELFKPVETPRWFDQAAGMTMFEREMQKSVALINEKQDQAMTFWQPDWCFGGGAAR